MKLTTDGLTKRYDGFELSIPDLDIESGTAFGLVGNNGAGKTTFLRLVLDLIRAAASKVGATVRACRATKCCGCPLLRRWSVTGTPELNSTGVWTYGIRHISAP
jgi:ABC-type branched-subunit amino acid transport system ATPase component